MAKEKKFENALARLEEIVDMLEAGDAPLEKSIDLFEEGMKLVKQCSKTLDDAEKKIQRLIKTETGFQLDLLDKVEDEAD